MKEAPQLDLSQFVITPTGRLIDLSKLPTGTSEFDYTSGRWIVPARLTGYEISKGRHLSREEAERIISEKRVN